MISYEVSIGFIIIGVIISAGSLNLSEIVMAQKVITGFLAGSGCLICPWFSSS